MSCGFLKVSLLCLFSQGKDSRFFYNYFIILNNNKLSNKIIKWVLRVYYFIMRTEELSNTRLSSIYSRFLGFGQTVVDE